MPETTHSHKNQFKHIMAEQSMIAAGIRGLGLFMGLFTTFLITRFWGAEAFGEFRIALATVGILIPFCTLGMNAGLVKFIPKFQAHGQSKRLAATLYSTFTVSILMSVLVTALLYLYQQYPGNAPEQSSLRSAINLGVWFITPLTLIAMVNAVYTSYKKTHWAMFFITIFARIIFLMLLTWLLLGDTRTGRGIVTSYLIAQWITAFIFLYYSPLRSLNLPKVGRLAALNGIGRRLFTYSGTLFISLLVLSIHEAFDTLALGYFKGATTTGIYNLCLRICEVSYIFTFAIMTILAPIISELHACSKNNEIETLLRQTTDWLVTLSLPLTLGLAFFAPEFLSFFGPEFAAGKNALILLSFSNSGILLLAVTVKCSLTYCGKERLILVDAICALILNITLNLLLIPRWGETGAALATCGTMIVMSTVYYFQSTRIMKLQPLHARHLWLAVNAAAIVSILLAGKLLLPKHWLSGAGCIIVSWLISVLLTFWRTPNKQDLLTVFRQRLKSGAIWS